MMGNNQCDEVGARKSEQRNVKSESDSGTEWKHDKGKTLQFLFRPSPPLHREGEITFIVSELAGGGGAKRVL